MLAYMCIANYVLSTYARHPHQASTHLTPSSLESRVACEFGGSLPDLVLGTVDVATQLLWPSSNWVTCTSILA